MIRTTREPQDRNLEPPEATPGAAPPSQAGVSLRARPVATLAIVAVNGLLWLVTVALAAPSPISNWLHLNLGPGEMSVLLALGAKDNALIQSGEYWRLIAPIFLHAGAVHLLVNSLAILILATTVERIYGPARLLVLYLFSGICGSVASFEFSASQSIGASGAIFGLAGVIIVFALRHRTRISARFRDEVMMVLLPLVLLQIALGFTSPQLDARAHLGGFLGGCLLACLVETPLAGAGALARESLPIEMALLTGVLLVGYAGVSAAANIRAQLPLPRLATGGPPAFGMAYLRGLVDRKPQLVGPRRLLAEVSAEAGDWSEVAEQCRAVLRHPGPPFGTEEEELETRMLFGQALERTGQRDEAASVYRDLLSRYWNNSDVLNEVAYLSVDSFNSNYRGALGLAKRAVMLQPNNGAYLDTLAWAYYKLGQIDQAAAYQERALTLRRNHPELRYHMGLIDEAQGKRQAAIEQYRAALRLDPQLAAAREGLARLGG